MSVLAEHMILLVEDNEDDVVLFRGSALQAGLNSNAFWLDHPDRVMAYLGGSQEFADRTIYPLPSLIFLSDSLYKASTVDLLSSLARQAPSNEIPIIVLSASRHVDFCALALAMGALECFGKPPSYSEWKILAGHLHSHGLPSPFRSRGPGASAYKPSHE